MGLDRLIPKERKPVSIEEIRALYPMGNPHVQTENLEDGSMLIVAPLDGQGRGIAAVMAKWMKLPPTKKFELEPVGAFVWSLCDGKHTVASMSRELQDKYKMNRLESEAALTAFLRTLGQRRLITMSMAKRGK